jgi:cell wall-associated NlpC family hydrolase
MKRIFLILGLLMSTTACAPYPRYSVGRTNTPREVIPDGTVPTTNDYLRFGSIVQQYIGKPYAGRSKFQPGLDCSLFTQEVIRAYAHKDIGRTVVDQYAAGTDIARNRMMPGDLVFFETERDRISHVGVFVGFNSFIHASSSQGVIISGLSEEYWAKRFVGCKRVLDLPSGKPEKKPEKKSDRKWEAEYKKKYGHK